MADWFVDGLVARGMPKHVAEAFAWNAADESRMDPGINEIAPIVPGSRGGFGLMQWTGPRRRALEAFAAERGVNVADPDLQLDFLMAELSGPEAAAASAIYAAPDAQTAAAAIVNKFLRPAESNRAKREAAYLGGSTGYTPSGAPGNALAGMATPSQPAQNALAAPQFTPVQTDVTPFLRRTAFAPGMIDTQQVTLTGRNALAMG